MSGLLGALVVESPVALDWRPWSGLGPAGPAIGGLMLALPGAALTPVAGHSLASATMLAPVGGQGLATALAWSNDGH